MADINGTSGPDTLVGTVGNDTINGFEGNDTLNGGDGADLLDGGLGNDQLDGGLGNDTLQGGANDDFLRDDYGVNVFLGGDGKDTIYSFSLGAGQQLFGGEGDDYLSLTVSSFSNIGSGSSADGGNGKDQLYILRQNQATVTGGDDNDIVSIDTSTGSFDGGSGNDQINFYIHTGEGGFSGPLIINGSAGGDTININDVYWTSYPSPTATIDGGADNDTIVFSGIQSSGVNLSLTGGTGSDTYKLKVGFAVTITDFSASGSGDIIDAGYLLQTIPGYPGGNPFATGHLVLLQQGADTLLQVDQDGTAGAGAPVTLATLTGVTATELTADNFGGYTPDSIRYAPTANSSEAATNEDKTLMKSVSAFDPDSPSLTYALTAGPVHGALTFANDGSWTYVPAANFNGADSFTFVANDGVNTSPPATVTLTINPVNDAPTGSATAVLPAGTEDLAYTVSAATLLQGFSDVDGDSLSVSGLGASSGMVTNNGDGTWTITQGANVNGPISLTYNVIDGQGGSAAGTRSYTLAAVNDAPVITSNGAGVTAAISISENLTAVTAVAATDIENGTALFYSIAGGADAARFAINSTTGQLSFVVAPDFESPSDVGANNIYDVIVRASDGSLFDDQALAITIGDVSEVRVYTGTSGNDTFTASTGENWVLNGQGGDDKLTGNSGNDTIDGGAGRDTLVGGSGIDTATYASATSGVTVSLDTNKQQNTVGAGQDTLSGFENLTGSDFADLLRGDQFNNVIVGGSGNDVLIGGGGNDTLIGSSGSDTFRIETTRAANGQDSIADFVAGLGGDILDLFANTNAAVDSTVTFPKNGGTLAISGNNTVYAMYNTGSFDTSDVVIGNGVDAMVLVASSLTSTSFDIYRVYDSKNGPQIVETVELMGDVVLLGSNFDALVLANFA